MVAIDQKMVPETVDNGRKGKVLLQVMTFGFSHMQYALTIGEWLVADGFTVHLLAEKFLATDKCDFPKCFTKVHIVEPIQSDNKKLLSNLTTASNNLITSGVFEALLSKRHVTVRNFLKLPILDEIQKENYDIAIGELFSHVQLIKFRELGIKRFVSISALPFNSVATADMGLPSPSSYLPIMDESFLCGDDMGFWERAWNLYTRLYIDLYLISKLESGEKRLLQELGYDADAALLLSKSFDLRVYNSSILLDYPRPTIHNIVHIGGSMVKEPSALEGPVKDVFSKPSDGVILISFGTLAGQSSFSTAFHKAVKATMEALPSYEFVFRAANCGGHTEFADLSNVTIIDWIDQVSVLAHPKTKLFYTHCGLNSFNEAMYLGVPLVATPLFGDQFYNAGILRKKGVGIAVELKTITPEKLISAFKRVLEEPSYDIAAKNIAQKMRDLPLQPKETFLRWINYINTHGAKQDFSLKSIELPFWKYYSLDVIVLTISVLFIIFFVLQAVMSLILK